MPIRIKAVISRETERNLQKIKDLARFWQTIQRRVILTGNQSSVCDADQSNYCYADKRGP